MGDTLKYNFKSLMPIIEETLRQAAEFPVAIKTADKIPLLNKVGEGKYYDCKIDFYEEHFIVRTIHNFKALTVLMPLMVNLEEERNLLHPVNLIMRNIITDFLTNSYLLKVFQKVCKTGHKDYEPLKKVFRQINYRIAKSAEEESKSNSKVTKELLRQYLPENFNESGEIIKEMDLMYNVKEWFNQNEPELKETIQNYYESYYKYFSKFEHINFATSQLFIPVDPFTEHCQAIGAGANQIMNCYDALDKKIDKVKIHLLINELPNYTPPEL
ncbi:MAG TPA: hypothetical protein VMV56_02245 [Williamwhitmania sp.]|nr:hypothetical protein [Williamwhitmania sp.]